MGALDIVILFDTAGPGCGGIPVTKPFATKLFPVN